ncbi:MAG: cupin-like domain-containing protein [Bacillota bacterium]
MWDQVQRADEVDGAGLESFPAELAERNRPAVLRGVAADWPFVREARKSDEAAVAYLERFYNGTPVNTVVAPPSEQGRLFYQADSKAMNYAESVQPLSNVLKGILQQRQSDEPLGIALQAISAADCLPGLEEDNPNPLVPEGTSARVWIGNKVTVAPHFDVADNLAFVMAGSRRFILFPPEQTANLYPGPMDVTPANVPISMVSLDAPDLERFPRYRTAMDAAVVAELEPGDAVYIPYMWWHGVQSLAGFNVLMNYWWNRDEVSARHPYGALLHLAYMLYGDMPPEQRQAWRALFDHYVFQTAGDPMEALEPAHRYYARKLDPARVARLKDALRELLG